MKRLATLFILAILVATAGFAKSKHKDLSGSIAVKGELRKEYRESPAGTPIVIRRVVKMNATHKHGNEVCYAVEINGKQETIPSSEMDIIAIAQPETDQEFWQQQFLLNHLYEYFHKYNYRHELRQEIDEECLDYLDKLNEIAYQDDYITSYVQGVFSKLNAITIDTNRKESLNIRVIQSAEPDAFMLPNGSMVVSTGLLCTLDSEDELAAVIACELGHFVLDHPVTNIHRAERRAKRAAFWTDVFAITADAALDVAYWNDDENAYKVGLVADIGAIASLLCIPATDRLGMKYKTSQELTADRIARKLLAFKGYNPDGVASALSKIRDYYRFHQRTKDIPRYNSLDDLQERIEKAGTFHDLQERPYLRTTGNVVSFNASMNYANKRYKETVRLIQKNIDNRLATDNDYVILVKAKMAFSNTEDTNRHCLVLLDKARDLAGTSPNLDIYKQKILLLMRMNKQAEAADILKEYLTLLSTYESQGIEGEEKEWAHKEMGWANQMLELILN